MGRRIISILAIVILCASWGGMIWHFHNLNLRNRPSLAKLQITLNDVRSVFGANYISPVATLDKSVYLATWARIRYGTPDEKHFENAVHEMLSLGWHEAPVRYGKFARFCRDNIVVEVPRGDGGSLQANWGNADAVCPH